MKRDDLKKHMLSQHAGKSPMAVRDQRQRKVCNYYIYTSCTVPHPIREVVLPSLIPSCSNHDNDNEELRI